MPPRTPQRERLMKLMNKRQEELGLTWAEIAAAGDISYDTIRLARNGSNDIRHPQRAAIDRGLRWQVGSVSRILEEDGDPVALDGPPRPAEPPAVADDAEERFPGDAASQAIWRQDISETEKWQAIAIVQRGRARRAEERAREIG
jgi:hypothetical protein